MPAGEAHAHLTQVQPRSVERPGEDPTTPTLLSVDRPFRESVQTTVTAAAELAQLLPPGVLHRIRISVGDLAIEVEGAPAPAPTPFATPIPGPATTPITTFSGEPPIGAPASPPQSSEAQAPGALITAPLVGVFYRSHNPGSPPFVEPGSVVRKGDTLAIVEAMKMMNEITADRDGVVDAVLAGDCEVVEFGQPLFRVTPADDGGLS